MPRRVCAHLKSRILEVLEPPAPKVVAPPAHLDLIETLAERVMGKLTANRDDARVHVPRPTEVAPTAFIAHTSRTNGNGRAAS